LPTNSVELDFSRDGNSLQVSQIPCLPWRFIAVCEILPKFDVWDMFWHMCAIFIILYNILYLANPITVNLDVG
jgi:hypothetical protein